MVATISPNYIFIYLSSINFNTKCGEIRELMTQWYLTWGKPPCKNIFILENWNYFTK